MIDNVLDMPEWGAPQELVLHTTASVDDLRQRWEFLSTLLSAVGQNLVAAGERWRQAPDSDWETKERLWNEFMAIDREYRVLQSWTHLFRAAYVFSTDGADCVALDGFPSN